MNPNCEYDELVGNMHRVLAWNMLASVAVRQQFDYSVIDVDFSNKSFHRNIVINDDHDYQMAAVSYSGVILASSG